MPQRPDAVLNEGNTSIVASGVRSKLASKYGTLILSLRPIAKLVAIEGSRIAGSLDRTFADLITKNEGAYFLVR
jgi:hypothetical protein